MLLALVSTLDSITSLPLPLRTAITIASLCTSMPIYLMSRLIPLPPWGKDHSRQRSLSLKVKCHSLADLPIFSSGSCPHPRFSPLNGPLSHNALTLKGMRLADNAFQHSDSKQTNRRWGGLITVLRG